MRQNDPDEIVRASPHVDPTAIERSRQVEKQLADAGIEVGGYHLTPALGGAIPKYVDQRPRSAPEEIVHADRPANPPSHRGGPAD